MPRLYDNVKTVYPEFTSPVPGYSVACGQSFHEVLEVRAPYRGTDQYVNALPIIYGDILLGSSDDGQFDQVLRLALQPKVREDIAEGVEGAREMVKNYRRDGLIDSENNATINKMLNRAEDYLKKAARIQEFWEDDAYINNELPQGWPLDQYWYPRCENKFAPQKASILVMTPKGAKTKEVTCPEKSVYEDHEMDRRLIVKLVQAALFNARCAQEAAASVGTYNRNKKLYLENEAKAGGKGLQGEGKGGFGGVKITTATLDPKLIPGIKKATLDPDLIDEDAPQIPSEDDEPADDESGDEGDGLPESDTSGPKKKVKKKDNTLLLAGAAAIGIFALKGK